MAKRRNGHCGILQSIRAFCRSEKGSVLPLVGIGFFVIMGVMGMAIDIGRGQLVESKLLNSIDAAGLAAGAKLNTSTVQAEVEKFVYANYPDGYVDSVVSSITTAVTNDGKTITVSATAVMQTAFMQLFGIDEMTIDATSEITRAIGGLELALVLDNTGSMSGSKLVDLKVAANDLLDIVFGSNSVGDDLFVGVVPFSQSVNIGTSRAGWIDSAQMNALDWGTTSWGGCVMARTGGVDRDTTDDPPTTELFAPYYWPDDRNNDWISRGRYRISRSRSPNKSCSAELTPMTNVKATVSAAIDDMTAEGYTHVNFGTVWGWRMLSPNWRSLWGGSMDTNELPLDYNTPNMNKAAVIMTDGANTFASSIRGAYGYRSEGRLNGQTAQGGTVRELNSRLLEVCTNMKNAGITVYTVAFGSPGNTIETMMQQCASQPDFYFDTPTGAELSLAFKMIGDSLANLRVSK